VIATKVKKVSKVSRAEESGSPSRADLLEKISRLEDVQRNMTSRIEELQLSNHVLKKERDLLLEMKDDQRELIRILHKKPHYEFS